MRVPPAILDDLIHELTSLREEILLHASRYGEQIAGVASGFEGSARNLLHYLALRQHDLRPLQRQLAELGLSSLGRSEAHALASVDAVLAVLYRLAGRTVPGELDSALPGSFASGPELLAKHTEVLLGPPPPGRDVRIMVTMPSEAAEDAALVRALVAAGMDVMRINAAHDTPEAWRAMIRHLEQGCRDAGRSCLVQLDLAGPKLRTGEIQPSARLVHWRVRRDVRGRTLEPARIWLAPSGGEPAAPPAEAGAVLTLPARLLARSRSGDAVHLSDSRGHRRTLRIVAADGPGRRAECDQGAYVEEGAPARLVRRGVAIERGRVGPLPPVVEPLVLERGDLLRVIPPARPGRPAIAAGAAGETLPAEIPCTLPAVFADLRPGQRVLFDDGKLASVIRRIDAQGVLVEITRAAPGGARLRADKGINLPDSALSLPPLSEHDLASLDFAIAHANLIGQSFVRGPADVRALQGELARRGGSRLGVLLKIETRAAFESLPRILLAGMCAPPVGVMVARGDLAVEIGYERMAEVQEEILWLCEAAHLPVVWATQVLESLAKKGRASRAEVTDAAMSGRAECVMLNKGPYVVDTVRFLADVLLRMKLHQEKKRSMLRRLSISSLSGRFTPAV